MADIRRPDGHTPGVLSASAEPERAVPNAGQKSLPRSHRLYKFVRLKNISSGSLNVDTLHTKANNFKVRICFLTSEFRVENHGEM